MGGDFRFSLKKKITANCLCLINDSGLKGLQNADAQYLGIPVIKSNEIFNLIKEVYYEQ